MPIPEFVKGRGRGTIAGHHHGGGTFADQVAADRKRPLADRVETTLAVGSESLVCDIDQCSVREQRSNLAQHTEQRQQLVANPDSVNAVIEELLRFETPVAAVPSCLWLGATVKRMK